MILTSTRNKGVRVDIKEAILKGLSDDGGLFVPEIFPKLRVEDLLAYANSNDKSLMDITFPEIVKLIWELYSDFDASHLNEAIKSSYSNFPIPLVKAGELNIVELFNGGSAAFKDVALSLFPKIVKMCMDSTACVKEVFFITATSGDTGKAAMEGIKNQPGMKLAVIYPANGVSELQERQMLSEKAPNILPVPINGDFDDAQRIVKDVLNSKEIENSSSCNSINIARLLTQISYYYYSYIKFYTSESLRGNKLNFVVPSGNFGNILAGYYAKKMGLPVGKLIAATNSNDVLYEFIKTGIYNRNRPLIKTTSPSMDIIVSSNVERLLYHELGEEVTRKLLDSLDETGSYKIPMENLNDFLAFSSTDEESSRMVKKVFEETGYVLDPHTACGAVALEKYGVKDDTVILATASPFKFPLTIVNALKGQGSSKKAHNALTEKEAYLALSKIIPIHPALAHIYERPLRGKHVVEAKDVPKILKKFKEDI